MPREIRISHFAESSLLPIIDYIRRHFGERSVARFKREVDEKMAMIAEFPEMCAEVELRPAVRMCLIARKTMIFYKIFPEKIEVLLFVDARMNPGAFGIRLP